jgi:hypothetical protein
MREFMVSGRLFDANKAACACSVVCDATSVMTACMVSSRLFAANKLGNARVHG